MRICGERRRTAREETVFGEDCDCVDEEDGDCASFSALLFSWLVKSREGGGGWDDTVEEVAEAEKHHLVNRGRGGRFGGSHWSFDHIS